jgi:hypothetical protein
MPKYAVSIYRVVSQAATVAVEAANEEQALAKAKREVADGDWRLEDGFPYEPSAIYLNDDGVKAVDDATFAAMRAAK